MDHATRVTGLSLLELLIALAILGLVAMLTLPQLGHADSSPTDGALLRGRLQVLRVAIERYYQDHSAFPAQFGDGTSAAATEAAFVNQLTGYTDATGRVSFTSANGFPFGPYLRDGVPACPVPPRAGATGVFVVTGSEALTFVPEPSAVGWIYNSTTGQVVPNSDRTDEAGRTYTSY